MLSAVIPDDLSPLSAGATTTEDVAPLLPAAKPMVHGVSGEQAVEVSQTESNASETISATLVTAFASAFRKNVSSALVADNTVRGFLEKCRK